MLRSERSHSMLAITVTRIAHVSDVHMLDPRPSRSRFGYSVGIRFLSIGRPLDAAARTKKLARSLACVARSGAQHVVVSGNLTEIGSPEEFEAFAGALHDSRISPNRITLVPGNHDACARRRVMALLRTWMPRRRCRTPPRWAMAAAAPMRASRRTRRRCTRAPRSTRRWRTRDSWTQARRMATCSARRIAPCTAPARIMKQRGAGSASDTESSRNVRRRRADGVALPRRYTSSA